MDLLDPFNCFTCFKRALTMLLRTFSMYRFSIHNLMFVGVGKKLHERLHKRLIQGNYFR